MKEVIISSSIVILIRSPVVDFLTRLNEVGGNCYSFLVNLLQNVILSNKEFFIELSVKEYFLPRLRFYNQVRKKTNSLK